MEKLPCISKRKFRKLENGINLEQNLSAKNSLAFEWQLPLKGSNPKKARYIGFTCITIQIKIWLQMGESPEIYQFNEG
jgi:hypothetical protein